MPLPFFKTDWSRIHNSSKPPFWTVLLAPLAALYTVGIRFRLFCFKKNIFKSQRLPGFVVSVGNITAGGTGKTPAISMLAQWARGRGNAVAILSRGYGGSYKSRVLDVTTKTSAEVAGDEPRLLAARHPEIPVILAKRRYDAGRYAMHHAGSDFLLLDDGFQHLSLERDMDILLVDAAIPFGNGHLLPWGPLREPLDQMARADAFVLTRFEGTAGEKETLAFLHRKFPGKPIFMAGHFPDKLIIPASGEMLEPDFLKGKRVLAFCAIGRPQSFKEILLRLDADIVHFETYEDHYRFRSEEIEKLIGLGEEKGADFILTTQKDWMRVVLTGMNYPRIGYLSIAFRFLPENHGLLDLIHRKYLEKMKTPAK